ncbi:MAG: leucyl aminopeptidase [Clostridia bacterium]|nr:leucyl aminopeptidase [Clostridia bacterium]
MRFTVTEQDAPGVSFDYEIVFVMEDNIANTADSEALLLAGFGKGSCLDLPGSRRVYVSIKNTEPDTIRRAIAKAVGALKGHQVKSVRMPHMKASLNDDITPALTAIAEAFVLSDYHFDKYMTKKYEPRLEEVFISVSGCDFATARAALEKGRIMAEAANYARAIGNEFPQVFRPQEMTAEAEKLAAEYETMTVESFGRDYLTEQGMNAFLAVNQGSPYEAQLIHVTYKPAGAAKGTVCFVGKGLTYDTGGVNLKSNPYKMKSDKCGAAAALGIVKAAADLGLPFEVHAVLGMTENMIGCHAIKPDDIVTARNGVTIEINNTDAEGRLVLADCLSWAQDMIKPDLIIDMATLTGAVVVGVGKYTTGVLGNSYALMDAFKKKAQASGEFYAVLEGNCYLEPALDSKVADVRNSFSGTPGGATLAALFLDRFIQDEYKDKWLHLDIAGPAYSEDAWGYNPAGATGIPVRGCLYYLMAD